MVRVLIKGEFTCVGGSWRGGNNNRGPIISHAQLASTLSLQQGGSEGGWGPSRPVPPTDPPAWEFQVQRLIQGKHGQLRPT